MGFYKEDCEKMIQLGRKVKIILAIISGVIVVGAGAVVAGKFEDNCVIAGNPARVIKRL